MHACILHVLSVCLTRASILIRIKLELLHVALMYAVTVKFVRETWNIQTACTDKSYRTSMQDKKFHKKPFTFF